MNQRNTHQLWKERLAILMVVVFCTLVSSADYLLHSSDVDVHSALHVDDTGGSESQDRNATFIHNAVDAVVPFVMAAVDHVLHFIYELTAPERQKAIFKVELSPATGDLLEVLFEHIVSANAP